MDHTAMIRSSTLLFAFFIIGALSAQQHGSGGQVAARMARLEQQGTAFKQIPLFKAMAPDNRTTRLWQEACTKAEVARLDPGAVAAMYDAAPAHIAITLPTPDGPLTVELERWAPLADGFVVNTATKGIVQVEPGAHYRGRVRGDDHSVVGLSVFRHEVMAMVKDRRGTLVVGRLDNASAGVHVIYREHDLRTRDPFICGTRDTGEAIHPGDLRDNGSDRSMRCVKLYWEVDYPIFTNKGSVAAATTYVTGLFNQSAILFANDGVDVQLQEVFVWDEASPYTGSSSNDRLSQFGTHRTSFNGDLAHLLSFGGGGGVAWLNTLCSSTTRYRMAYSGINATHSNVPTYSWSVNVVTHEQGHNMGSPHTHDCAWNGNGTPIDGCGPAAGYPVAGCEAVGLPTGGGTIMSYCHLVSGVGMNFNNGFGPQPATLIRNRVNAASCLAQCGTTCDAPGTLSVSSLTSNSATLGWSNVGAVSYTLRWKAEASGTWTVVSGITGTTHALTGLAEDTAYEFQVLSECADGTSAYSPSRLFTTPTPCPDALEPNNTFATAAAVTLPLDMRALIASSADVDYYTFTTTAIATISIGMSGMPADYDVRLLNATGTQLALSQNGGTSSEYITYANAPAGSYVVHVFGYNGANSPVACYNLWASAFAIGCLIPEPSPATDITYHSATLGWASEGAFSYELQWREVGAQSWTLVTGLELTSHALEGLQWSTAHEFRVRAVCSESPGGTQGGRSEWSRAVGFTTLAPPCDVVPPAVVAAKMLLDGAWRNADQLMVDSLRAQGELPHGEPYTDLGHVIAGPTVTAPEVLATTGQDAIVDWVVLELRSSTTPAEVLEARAALLQRDGDIVGIDGTSPVGFCQPAGSYHIAVRHRNHLGAMTAQPVALSTAATAVDFSAPATATWGTNAQKSANGRTLLWPGNTVSDAEVKYTGSTNDRDAILQRIGGTVPTNTVQGYHAEDVNLDGAVKYTGPDNDRDVILGTVGGTVPTNAVGEQLP
ncbi:MAG: fibronectin type III domain-containing protein [Flavobacteriales bacterium]|nr:fibronectin type III domain-containing protein [Flavobacteriales bacterium]